MLLSSERNHLQLLRVQDRRLLSERPLFHRENVLNLLLSILRHLEVLPSLNLVLHHGAEVCLLALRLLFVELNARKELLMLLEHVGKSFGVCLDLRID